MSREPITIRSLAEGDPEVISDAFTSIGWPREAEQFRSYLAEQEDGRRSVFVAEVGAALAAHRLYVLRGYVPDGLGLTYGDRYVEEDETVVVDNSLILHFTKDLSAPR